MNINMQRIVLYVFLVAVLFLSILIPYWSVYRQMTNVQRRVIPRKTGGIVRYLLAEYVPQKTTYKRKKEEGVFGLEEWLEENVLNDTSALPPV